MKKAAATLTAGMHSVWVMLSPMNIFCLKGRPLGKALPALMLACLIVFGVVGMSAAGGHPVKAQGMLTSIEEDGNVVIDNKGYAVAFSARVLNFRKEHIALEDLKLPTAVSFVYTYTRRGPVIRRIRELPQ
ncbi:MAG TPA: hypothetical protein DCO77_12830 [Nitrospiraceae bacterium]|nr:hypothetical protein [Nitrospiraceae bacterium]